MSHGLLKALITATLLVAALFIYKELAGMPNWAFFPLCGVAGWWAGGRQ